jgi:hypothetical protein
MARVFIKDEADSTSDDDTDSLSEESGNIKGDEEWLFDDEEQHPPEHYITAVANLNITRLQQQLYSPRT